MAMHLQAFVSTLVGIPESTAEFAEAISKAICALSSELYEAGVTPDLSKLEIEPGEIFSWGSVQPTEVRVTLRGFRTG